MVVIADGDLRAGTDVVVDLRSNSPDGAGVGVALQIAAHPVVAVAEAVRKQLALGIQQQARRFDCGAGETITRSAVCSCRRSPASK